ncbi:helix-turn-helix domain-containing protein [Legionella spiritensis]|uniref:helix-turn-helix domain-containing protein n=1 Tax=Legionella spiritensis TaxID=452 RepID=UPI0009EA67FD|nr:helix-turn-helix domain-containing protein [Legionella spiritensis]
MKTLNIQQAAEFLGAHKETVRRMAARKQIPGVKIGRSWIFIEHDLVTYIRNKYSSNDASQGDHRRLKWHSTKEMKYGGLISGTKEKEYAKVLGLK